MRSASLLLASALLARAATAAGAAELAAGTSVVVQPSTAARAAVDEGLAHAHRGEHRVALKRYERAQALNRDPYSPRLDAALLYLMGVSWNALGETQRAIPALQRCNSVSKSNGFYHFKSLFLLASITKETRKDKDGREIVKRLFALAADQAAGQGVQADEAAAALNLGVLRLDEFDFGGARFALQRAVDLSEAIGDQRTAAYAQQDLSYVLGRLGEPGAALRAAERSLELLAGLDDPATEAEALVNAAADSTALGELERAFAYLERALAISRGRPEMRMTEAAALFGLGQLFYDRGEKLAAAQYMQGALALSEEAGEWGRIVEVSSNLAGLYMMEGRFLEAQLLIDRFGLLLTRAELLRLTGDVAASRRMYREMADKSREMRESSGIVVSSIGLGLAAEAQGDKTAARRGFEDAVREIERQRELLRLGERGRYLHNRIKWFRRLDAYEGRVRAAADAADAFYWSESSKARTFVDSISTRAAAGVLPPGYQEEESRLKAELRELREQDWLAFQRRELDKVSELAPRLRAAEERLAGFAARLRLDDETRAYASVSYPQPWQAVDVPLRPGEVLIEYAVTASSGVIFVLAPGRPVLSLPLEASRARLAGLVKAFRAPLDHPFDALGRFRVGYDSATASELYDLLLLPALEARGEDGAVLVSSGTRVIIVPDGPLGGLPFEALPLPADRAERRYAGDELDIAYAQSATALGVARSLRKGDASGKGLFVLADPVFDDCDPRASKKALVETAMQAERRKASVRTMGAVGRCARLQETGRLAKRLKESFGSDAAPPLLGLDATLESLEHAGLDAYRYLVFATHGYLAGDVSYLHEPALLLSRDKDGGESFLSMSRVMGMRLDADLVALTACNTGMGTRVEGEGTLGMGRAFQHAGARNVLMSLWRVEERSTTTLMDGVFRRVRAGAGVREALRAARAELRADGHDHPFYWAPFVLMAE